MATMTAPPSDKAEIVDIGYPYKEILERTEKLIQQGAAGIVYGRNIIQHANPGGMTRALMSIVHDGATASSAAKFI